jgi:hypothetical protein
MAALDTHTFAGVDRRWIDRRRWLDIACYLNSDGPWSKPTNLCCDPVNLLADLLDFVNDHHPHSKLTADATEPAWDGYLLTVACGCGAVFERWVTNSEAIETLAAWSAREGGKTN